MGICKCLAPIHTVQMYLRMIDFHPLPFQDNLHADESLMGFVLRMSNRNGISGIHWLYRQLGRDKLNRFKEEDKRVIAGLFGAEMSRVNSAMVRSRRIDGLNVYEMHGHRINKSYLARPLRPQLCPACVSENGYARSLWDFSLVCACPWHNCTLIDACPACLKKIQWMRPSLLACNCGFIWKNSRRMLLPAEDASICIARIVHSKLDLQHSECSANSLDRTLSALNLDTLMRVIWAFGIKPTASEVISTGTSRIILRSDAAAKYCARGYARLHDLLAQEDICKSECALHFPSIYLLTNEVSSLNDIKFLETLLKKINPAAAHKYRIGSVFNQLNLF